MSYIPIWWKSNHDFIKQRGSILLYKYWSPFLFIKRPYRWVLKWRQCKQKTYAFSDGCTSQNEKHCKGVVNVHFPLSYISDYLLYLYGTIMEQHPSHIYTLWVKLSLNTFLYTHVVSYMLHQIPFSYSLNYHVHKLMCIT